MSDILDYILKEQEKLFESERKPGRDYIVEASWDFIGHKDPLGLEVEEGIWHILSLRIRAISLKSYPRE